MEVADPEQEEEANLGSNRPVTQEEGSSVAEYYYRCQVCEGDKPWAPCLLKVTDDGNGMVTIRLFFPSDAEPRYVMPATNFRSALEFVQQSFFANEGEIIQIYKGVWVKLFWCSFCYALTGLRLVYLQGSFCNRKECGKELSQPDYHLCGPNCNEMSSAFLGIDFQDGQIITSWQEECGECGL